MQLQGGTTKRASSMGGSRELQLNMGFILTLSAFVVCQGWKRNPGQRPPNLIKNLMNSEQGTEQTSLQRRCTYDRCVRRCLCHQSQDRQDLWERGNRVSLSHWRLPLQDFQHHPTQRSSGRQCWEDMGWTETLEVGAQARAEAAHPP